MTAYGSISIRKITKKDYTISSLLDYRRTRFLSAITTLKEVNRVTPISTEMYYQDQREQIRKKIQSLDKTGKAEFNKWANFLGNGIDNKILFLRDKKVNDITDRIWQNNQLHEHLPVFVREMSLIYLVASFEDFLSSSLRLATYAKKEILKRSDKSIDFKQLVDFSNYEDVLKYAIQLEIDSLFFKDIEDINHHLAKRFNLDLSKDHDWSTFKEVFYRRNIAIHNNLEVNATYARKTGYKGRKSRLDVSQQYLRNAYVIFDKYANQITDHFLTNMNKKDLAKLLL